MLDEQPTEVRVQHFEHHCKSSARILPVVYDAASVGAVVAAAAYRNAL